MRGESVFYFSCPAFAWKLRRPNKCILRSSFSTVFSALQLYLHGHCLTQRPFLNVNHGTSLKQKKISFSRPINFAVVQYWTFTDQWAIKDKLTSNTDRGKKNLICWNLILEIRNLCIILTWRGIILLIQTAI